jgi:hypothetical protein
MQTFVSTYRLFEISLPEDWQQSFEANVYTFQVDETSALQISAMFHRGRKKFDLQEELHKVETEHPTATISELSEYGAVHYGLDMLNEKMLQYIWITGYENVKLLCTLTISSKLESNKLDAGYEQAVEILDTLKIYPPGENA